MVALGGVAALSVGASIAAGYHAAGRVGGSVSGGAWHGRIEKIVRAPGSNDPSSGITLRTTKGTTSAVEGADLSAGAEIATDARTRARIGLDDGTTLALDRGTRIRIEPGARSLRLEQGQLVADVAHLEHAPPAMLTTATGQVSVLGTKLALTSADDRTSVEVMRGAVELRDGASTIQIGEGQEGVAARGQPLTVSPVNDLAQRLAFGEKLGLSGVHNEDTDLPVSGLGELRAKKPGKTDEKDRALAISHHGAKVRIAGNVARTEIDETFTNDTGDDLEGIYRFPLPPDAQIERLALEVDGKLVDGSFVDAAKGEAIFRGAIHNATPNAPKPKEEMFWVPGPWHDPALLEWQRGGRFELHIFPIPKHGSRRVVLAYTEAVAPVAGLRRYTYPLPDAANLTIGSFDVDVQVIGQDPSTAVRVRGYELTKASSEGKAERFSMSAQGFVPSGDLTVEYALADRSTDVTSWGYVDPGPPPAPVAAGGDARAGFPSPLATPPAPQSFVALAFRPKLTGWTEARGHDVVLVVDAGRAMFGERFQRARRLAVQVAQEMDRRDRLAILACDTTCRAMPGGLQSAGSSAAHDADAFLANVEPDGATDLVGAVRAAATVGGRDPAHDLRVVVLSDGIASAGYRSVSRIANEVHDALPGAHDEAVVVPIGADSDVTTLGEIARGGGGVVVPYAPGEMLETAALDVLNATYGITLRDVELTFPTGLVDIAPATMAPIRAGGEVIVAARMTGVEVDGDAVLRGKVAGEPFEARYPLHVVASNDVGNAFVPRLYAAARIADVERAAITPTTRAEAVALSSRYRVASRFTSLLVLESEAMYQAFGIKRDEAASAMWTGEQQAQATDVTTLALGDGRSDNADKDVSDPFGAGDVTGGFSGLGSLGHGAGMGGGGSSGGGLVDDRKAGATPAARRPRPSAIVAGEDEGAAEPKRKSEAATKGPAAPAPTTSMPTAPPPANEHGQAVSSYGEPRDALDGSSSGTWMKRIWVRRATMGAAGGVPVAAERIERARAALADSPDERAKYMELVKVLAAAGSSNELGEVLARWSARAPLDDAATTARADLAASAGDRERALRIVDGVATGINAPTTKVETLERLALVHERAGETVASCAFRIAAADVRADVVGAKAAGDSDVTRFARAVACERQNGHPASGERWLAGRADRSAIEATITKVGDALHENASIGDFVVSATWDPVANVDLDVAIVDPTGNRYAWDTKANGVRVVDPTSRSHEQLAVSRWATGAFSIEIVRGSGATGPVSGRLEVKALGETTSVPFTLTGVGQRVARVDVSVESQLVPVTTGSARFDREAASSRMRSINVSVCAQNGGPSGSGRAMLTFEPSGTVSSVSVTTPFSGTFVGSCVTRQLSRIHVEPFSGGPVVLSRSFVIPP